MRESGSLAVFLLVSFFFIPDIRRQKEIRRFAASGDLAASAFFTGRLMFLPSALSAALPFSFSPPSGSLPSFRCHAGDLGILLVLGLLLPFLLAHQLGDLLL